MHARAMMIVLFGILIGQPAAAQEPETWRGLTVQPAVHCAEYVRDHYDSPFISEADLQNELGATAEGWYGIYEARIFASGWETHVEHMVAAYEAHISGLCGRSREERRAFASDLNNYTLASPELNLEKGSSDAGEWLPPNARCWFARTVLHVKRRHGLSVDTAERDELQRVLSACEAGEVPPRTAAAEVVTGGWPAVQTYRNCTAMRAAGWNVGVNRAGGTYKTEWNAAEIETYELNTSRDRDGHACE